MVILATGAGAKFALLPVSGNDARCGNVFANAGVTSAELVMEISDHGIVSVVALVNAPVVAANSVTTPALLRNSAVTAPVPMSPEAAVAAIDVPSPMFATGTWKSIRLIVPTVAAPYRPPVPTRKNKTFGIVMLKSSRAAVFNAPPPVTVADSACASIGTAMANATADLIITLRMVLLSKEVELGQNE